MRRYAKDNNNDLDKSKIDELKADVDITDENQEIEITDVEDIDAPKYEREAAPERKLSRRLLGMDSEKVDIKRRRDARGTKHSKNRKNRDSKDNKVLSWLYTSIFTIGHARITRLFAITSFLVIALVASGATLYILANDILSKKMPIENEELILTPKLIYIQDGEDTVLVKSSGESVSDVLLANDISLGEEDLCYPEATAELYNRMYLNIKRAKKVTIKTLSDEQTITFYSGTVEDALKEAGIEYDSDDIVEPELQTEVKEDTSIRVDTVEVKTVTEEVDVEYETEYRETSTVLKGMYALEQKGVDGLAEVTYEVTFVNGVETSRKAVEDNMIKEPVNRVELHGTALTRAGDDNEDEEDEVSVENPDDQTTNPTVPGTTSSYVKTVSCMITAYTHTGNKTATGTWPRSTRTLENPGSCAVVPDTFPYGSLLYVPGYGYCIAEDTGGFRHKADRWNQIDVFMNTVQECLNWGRKRDVTVYVIRIGY